MPQGNVHKYLTIIFFLKSFSNIQINTVPGHIKIPVLPVKGSMFYGFQYMSLIIRLFHKPGRLVIQSAQLLVCISSKRINRSLG